MISHCKSWYDIRCKWYCQHGYTWLHISAHLLHLVACLLHLGAHCLGDSAQNDAQGDLVVSLECQVTSCNLTLYVDVAVMHE